MAEKDEKPGNVTGNVMGNAMGNVMGNAMGTIGGNVVPMVGRKCPICGKPADLQFRPFCSKRCVEVDLGKWLGEGYRVETDEMPDPDEPLPRDEGQ